LNDQKSLVDSSFFTGAVMSVQATGEAYEEEHVHTVYEQIASHFSSTRYKVCLSANHTIPQHADSFLKPWPIIERFLKGLVPGSVGLDVGCGNGKYLAVNRDIFIVGSDRYDQSNQAFDLLPCNILLYGLLFQILIW
jgi:hypothetical protein